MHLRLPSDEHDHDHHHGHHHDHHHHHHDGAGTARFWRAAGLLLLLALAAAVAWRTVFFVDETEYVYVTQFGQPLRLYTEAGLGIKWPYQSLRRFDRRLQMYEPPGREMLTEDKENLTFHWYVCWRIPGASFVQAQPAAAAAGPTPAGRRPGGIEIYVRRFLQSVGTTQAAERRLEERIQAAIAAEIGRTKLGRLVSLTPGEVQLEAIAQRVTQSIRGVAAEQFGIEVVDVRWKRFNYPEAVKPAVYAEIRSERERVAIQYRAEGRQSEEQDRKPGRSAARAAAGPSPPRGDSHPRRRRGQGDRDLQRGAQQGPGLLRVAQDAGDLPHDPGQSDHDRVVGRQSRCSSC